MVTEANKNSPKNLQKDDLNEILKRAKIETVYGEYYQNPQNLIKKAVEYWGEKDRPKVVENIKTIFPF